jgi:peptidoglycan/LPS O-acetylase OafA/YrhL
MDSVTFDNAGRRRTVVGLDILRLFAALLVVSYHFLFFSWAEPAGHGGIRDAVSADIAFPGAVAFSWWGWVGVELFFVISGFVISMSATGKSATDFAVGRLARLYPALLCFSVAALIVVIGGGILSAPIALDRWLRAATLFPQGPWIDGVIWTLVVEAAFYLVVFAIILSGQIARLPTMARIGLAILTAFWAMVVASYLADLGLVSAALQSLASAYSSKVILLTTGAFFLLGMFAYEMFERGITRQRLGCVALAMFGCLASIWHSASGMTGVLDLGTSPLVPMAAWLLATLLCGAVIAIERARPPSRHYRALARRLGLITYPLYLMHNITGGWIMGRLRESGASMEMAALLALAICLAVSYLFAALVEPPMQRLLRQWLLLGISPARSGV